MLADSIRHLKSKGLTVFFEAEHLFDGYKRDSEYAFRIIEAAAEAGADCVVYGGSMPSEVAAIISQVKNRVATPLGIHTHIMTWRTVWECQPLMESENGALLVPRLILLRQAGSPCLTAWSTGFLRIKGLKYLREKGYRLTPQRLLILNILHHAQKHITAEEIHTEVLAKYPKVNLPDSGAP